MNDSNAKEVKVGDCVAVTSGELVGKSGTIKTIDSSRRARPVSALVVTEVNGVQKAVWVDSASMIIQHKD
jgi:ribosomal protein L24